MKIASYTIIHYGVDYLPWALGAISHYVDKSYVFYTAKPSHNHMTNVPCPETFEDVKQAINLLPEKETNIELIEQSDIRYEGQQRDWAKQYVINDFDPDILLVVDADEIWPEQTLLNVLAEIEVSGRKVETWRVNMTHLWKSFNWHCPDNGWPDRIFDLRSDKFEQYGYISKSAGPIYHFGYAIRNEIMQYKWKIHGHKNELRNNWLQTKWMNWKPGVEDVHPTNAKHFWDPEPFDKRTLPQYMRYHPFYELEIIQ